MNRREFLKVNNLNIYPRIEPQYDFVTATGRGAGGGLSPYAGEWTIKQAAHLAKRLTFGARKKDIDALLTRSVSQAVLSMITESPEPPPPINDYNDDDFTDPYVPVGEPWAYKELAFNDVHGYRISSLKTWTINNLMSQELNIQEKMVLFWHNHLVTQTWGVYNCDMAWEYVSLLRAHALGNFKTLIKAITIDRQMLIYLNNASNNKYAPDENYGRELQELFCIGKGPDSKYTEEDVRAAARVLTGWSLDWEHEYAQTYYTWAHDEDDKQFSAFYGNRVIKGRGGEEGKQELDELIDMLFENTETARFLCRKLYRFFVYHNIDDQTETNVIIPLADILRNNNYEIKPVLVALFTSEHFFDTEIIGTQVKGPLDFNIGFWRSFDIDYNKDSQFKDKFYLKQSLLWHTNELGQEILDPPNVAGWPAYHQEPIYDKSWMTTTNYTKRAIISDSFIYWGFWSPTLLTSMDVLGYISTLNDPADPDALVKDLMDLHFPLNDNTKIRAYLKAILLSGQQQDHYWADAWNNYVTEPGNDMYKGLVLQRLQYALQYLTQSAEYHLM